jgi:metallo-beta-lactamase family protein
VDDLCRFLSSQDPEQVKKIFLVHGEYAVQKAFCDKLELKGFRNVEVPAQHEAFESGAKAIKKAA